MDEDSVELHWFVLYYREELNMGRESTAWRKEGIHEELTRLWHEDELTSHEIAVLLTRKFHGNSGVTISGSSVRGKARALGLLFRNNLPKHLRSGVLKKRGLPPQSKGITTHVVSRVILLKAT